MKYIFSKDHTQRHRPCPSVSYYLLLLPSWGCVRNSRWHRILTHTRHSSRQRVQWRLLHPRSHIVAFPTEMIKWKKILNYIWFKLTKFQTSRWYLKGKRIVDKIHFAGKQIFQVNSLGKWNNLSVLLVLYMTMYYNMTDWS